MQFAFATSARIIFGPGSIKDLTSYITLSNKRIFVVTGRSKDRSSIVKKILSPLSCELISYRIKNEPTTNLVYEAVQKAREFNCDSVIGIGGGSVLDTGKVVAALLTNQGKLIDYLEVIGNNKKLENQPVPYIAIPTTSGTGAEVTRNAVIKSSNHRVKVSMRDYSMIPKLSIIDPELTLSMPQNITAATGIDAFTQLMEAYVSNSTNPITDGLCREGMHCVAHSLLTAFEQGNELSAREDMSLASLFGGIALANAKLGAVHGFAGPIGGMFDIPHGVICARFLSPVMKINIRALQQRYPKSPALQRYLEIARIITKNPHADLNDGIQWTHNLCNFLQIPSLTEFDIPYNAIPSIVEKSARASSMKGNPVSLTNEELVHIVTEALAS